MNSKHSSTALMAKKHRWRKSRSDTEVTYMCTGCGIGLLLLLIIILCCYLCSLKQ